MYAFDNETKLSTYKIKNRTCKIRKTNDSFHLCVFSVTWLSISFNRLMFCYKKGMSVIKAEHNIAVYYKSCG